MTNSSIVQYSYLQFLDLLTTLAFIVHGVQEGNPVVRWAMGLAGSPLAGLLLVKLASLLLGVFCWYSGRLRLLGRVNLFFAVVIAWNLVALVVSAFAR